MLRTYLRKRISLLGVTTAFALAIAGIAGLARAHCDTMGGPVIPEAQAALEKGDVMPVLKWVKAADEQAIKEAFTMAVAVRTTGAEAQTLADRYFLETLVRLHRAGEGAPYTGISAAPVEPIVTWADQALAQGSPDGMIEKMAAHMASAVREKFAHALAAKQSKDSSVDAGREYAEAYVTYMHAVEGIHDAIVTTPGHQH